MVHDGSSLLWLGLVIVAIPATLWFLKRAPLGQAPLPGTDFYAIFPVVVRPARG